MIRFGFAFLLIAFGSFFSLAQVVPDTTHINIGDKTIIVIDANPSVKPEQSSTETAAAPGKPDSELKNELTHFAGIDFGFCQLMDANGSTTRDTVAQWLSLNGNRSLTWRFNLLEKKFRIYHDYIGVYTGFAIAYNSYGLDNNVDVLTDSEDKVLYAVSIDPQTRNYHKNKIRNTILQVPLMLEFNSRKEIKKNFHFAAGAIGGWVTSTITKQKWENETGKYTNRRKEEFEVTPFTLDLSARVGYKKTALFVSYSLTPLFNSNKGPVVYPIAFGVQLSQF
jgi:uncharacterized glyoxalase superfamily protein PhnB